MNWAVIARCSSKSGYQGRGLFSGSSFSAASASSSPGMSASLVRRRSMVRYGIHSPVSGSQPVMAPDGPVRTATGVMRRWPVGPSARRLTSHRATVFRSAGRPSRLCSGMVLRPSWRNPSVQDCRERCSMLVRVAVFRLPLGVVMNWVRRPASAQPSRRANLGSVSGAKSSGWPISMSVRSAGRLEARWPDAWRRRWPIAWRRCFFLGFGPGKSRRAARSPASSRRTRTVSSLVCQVRKLGSLL